jgi:hypothetical protein
MEIEVKALNEDGSIAFQGVLRQKEVNFVMGVGINFLLANGAAEFLEEHADAAEEDNTMFGPGTTTKQ